MASNKLPFMQFYPADYIQDTSCLSLEEQGAWMRLLCAMWVAPERGKLDWSDDRCMRFLGFAPDVSGICPQFVRLISGLCHAQVGEISHDDVTQRVTVMSRRMIREEHERIQARERKQKERHRKSRSRSRNSHAPASDPCHAFVTPDISETRVQKLKEEEERSRVTQDQTPAFWNNRFPQVPKPDEPVELSAEDQELANRVKEQLGIKG